MKLSVLFFFVVFSLARSVPQSQQKDNDSNIANTDGAYCDDGTNECMYDEDGEIEYPEYRALESEAQALQDIQAQDREIKQISGMSPLLSGSDKILVEETIEIVITNPDDQTLDLVESLTDAASVEITVYESNDLYLLSVITVLLLLALYQFYLIERVREQIELGSMYDVLEYTSDLKTKNEKKLQNV